jgi:hypothetical protein
MQIFANMPAGFILMGQCHEKFMQDGKQARMVSLKVQEWQEVRCISSS